jgi:hypothetical protein
MPGRICVAGIAIKEKLLHLLGGMGVNPDSCIATLDAAACPDFLHAGLRNGHVCGFLNGKPHGVHQRQYTLQEIRSLRLSLRKAAWSSPAPPIPTGNPVIASKSIVAPASEERRPCRLYPYLPKILEKKWPMR